MFRKGLSNLDIKGKLPIGADIQSKVLAFAFGLSAELSKSLLQARIKESLARLKANGKKLGRPLGAKAKSLKLAKNRKKLLRLLNEGIPKSQIAKILNVDRSTLYAFLKNYIE